MLKSDDNFERGRSSAVNALLARLAIDRKSKGVNHRQVGARGKVPHKNMDLPQAGHLGGGGGVGGTTAGARKSSKATSRSHLTLAAAARQP